MKRRSILIRGARQLLTLNGPSGPRRGDSLRDLGIIEDGSVLIVDGMISSVGPTRRIENLAEARSAEEVNASGRAVLPGFVDSHTHLMSGPGRLTNYRMGVGEFSGRSPLGDASAFAAACQYVRNTPAATLEFAAGRYIEACLRHGTTTIEIKTGYGLNAAGELKMLRVLAGLNDRCVSVVPTFLGAHAVPPEYFGRNQEYLAWLCTELLPRLQERRVAQFVDVLCDPEGFSLDETRVYLDAARRLGLAVKVHAEQNSHTGAARLAIESDAASVDGLNHADDTDADLLARSRAVAVLLPGSVHQGSYSRFPPARMLIRAGVAVALASGFQPAVCSAFNIQMILSLACTHLGMTPEEAISAATINGAHALGRAQRCGSLQFGKDADLIIMNVSDYREIPFYYGCNLAAAVMRRGEIVYREGAVTCGAAP